MADPHRFGRVVVQPTERLLLVDGHPATVGARAFDLLLALIAHRDRLVTKDELLELVWPGLVVEEHNLQVQVSTLRKLLGPGAIATIPGQGYRLALRMDDPAAGVGEATAPRLDEKPSIVLMPFSAWGDSAHSRMLAASATEEIASALARLTGLSLVTVADAALYAVSGRIQRAVGRTRATVHLVDRRSAKEFWSEHFDTDLRLAVDAIDHLAFRISTAVRYEIHARESEMAKSRQPDDLSDQELMTQAGHMLLGSSAADWKRSRALIERVIVRSPDNFMALAIRACGSMDELFCGYQVQSAEDADLTRRLAQQALQLNERSDFAHCILGSFNLYGEADVGAAMAEARRSLELNANYILSMDLLGAAMIFAGDAATGLPHCLRAAQANPRFPANAWFMQSVALGHFTLQAYDSAVEWARQADQRERNIPRVLLALITCAWHAGQHDLARREASRLLMAFPDFRLPALRRWPFKDPAHWARFQQGLVASGLT